MFLGYPVFYFIALFCKIGVISLPVFIWWQRRLAIITHCHKTKQIFEYLFVVAILYTVLQIIYQATPFFYATSVFNDHIGIWTPYLFFYLLNFICTAPQICLNIYIIKAVKKQRLSNLNPSQQTVTIQ